VWPWSYSKCGEIPHLDSKQEINACSSNPGYGMHPHMGRYCTVLSFISGEIRCCTLECVQFVCDMIAVISDLLSHLLNIYFTSTSTNGVVGETEFDV
jgi:hypothetical protein